MKKEIQGRLWLTPAINKILASYLKKTDQMIEFGSGRSTLWFAKHVGHVTSVEHHAGWHEKVTAMFAESGVVNIDYLLCPIDDEDQAKTNEPYIQVPSKFADNSLDIVLVDGAFRGLCALASIPKIKPGGFLVVDNVNWFLPNHSKMMKSRSMEDGPLNENWQQVQNIISDWRVIWTTCGISDTAIFIKP